MNEYKRQQTIEVIATLRKMRDGGTAGERKAFAVAYEVLELLLLYDEVEE